MPNTPTITVADNADGTGGVITVTGSSGGSANQVFTNSPRTGLWIAGNSRVGDGTIAVPVNAGYYWIYVLSTLAGQSTISNVLRTAFTLSLTAVRAQIHTAVVAGLQDIVNAGKLPGIADPTRVLSFWGVPDWRQIDLGSLPCVLAIGSGKDPAMHGTNIMDDYGHPVLIDYVDGAGDDFTMTPGGIFDLARERIKKFFIRQRLTAVTLGGFPVHYDTSFEPGPIVDFRPKPSFRFAVSEFTLRFTTREARGI